MQIKEVEEKTGLTRSNIRFYEKEKLIQPLRNEKNGYKEYSKEDVATIKKIAYLRTLGVSIEDIHNVIGHKVSLYKVIAKQEKALDSRIAELKEARKICKEMLQCKDSNFEQLEIERYVKEPKKYLKSKQKMLKLDTAGFVAGWGGSFPWAVITIMCLLTAVLSVFKLPGQIPIQWRNGKESTSVSRAFIFAYPAACVLFRVGLRPFIFRWLQMKGIGGSLGASAVAADYLTNFLCFLALSIQLFTILFVFGLAESVAALIIMDAAVFLGVLIAALKKMAVTT